MTNWKGTAVPNTGIVEKVYFNTNLSNEEVISLLSQLTYIEDLNMTYLLTKVDNTFNLIALNVEGGYALGGVDDTNSEVYYWVDEILAPMMGISAGWQSFDNPIEVNGEVASVSANIEIGSQNSLLSSLFSITPFTQEEEAIEVTYNVGTWLTPSDEYIKDIKQTLVENNYANENTPIGELNPIVQQVIDEVPETFEKMDLSKKKVFLAPSFTYIYYHSNGIDAYGSYSSSNKGDKGVYHLNIITGEITQIYTGQYGWRNFFEDSKGKVYVGSDTHVGLLLITGKTATLIDSIGRNWQNFFESSNGSVYVGTISTSYGILRITNETVTQIATEYNWSYFFESSKGDLYVSGNSSSNKGIFKINGDSLLQIYSAGYNWQNFFESSNGSVYVGAIGDGGSRGIFCIEGEIVTQIYTEGSEDYRWCYFFEGSNGIVYVSGNASYGTGILLIEGETVKKIYFAGYGWSNFFETNNKKIYVSPNSSKYTGILLIEGETVKKIYNQEYNWQYFIEKPEGIIAAKTPQPDGSDFLLIDEDTDQVYLVKGGE